MRRDLLLTFVAANLVVALVVVFQMATEPEAPRRAKAPETGGYYELFSGDYVPSDEELGVVFPDSTD